MGPGIGMRWFKKERSPLMLGLQGVALLGDKALLEEVCHWGGWGVGYEVS